MAVAVALWLALVLYPLSLTTLPAPLTPVAAASVLCFGGAFLTGRWPVALAACALWIVEYASALSLAGRADLAAPVLALMCWSALELFDWHRLSSLELRLALAHAAGAGAMGCAAAIACVGAGLVVAGTVPLLAALGALAGIAALILAVALVRRAVGSDLFTTTRAERGSQ